MERIFVILTELAPTKGCQLDPKKIAGAAVRFYIAAADSDRAKKRLAQWAVNECFRLVEIEWCVDNDEVEWEQPDNEIGQKLISLARKTGEVVHGEFHVWAHDAPDA